MIKINQEKTAAKKVARDFKRKGQLGKRQQGSSKRVDFQHQQQCAPAYQNGSNTREHKNSAGQSQNFQNNAGGRGSSSRRYDSYQRPGRDMNPLDRRMQIQGQDNFRDVARGSGHITSNSNLVSGNGAFRQAPPWDGWRQYQGWAGDQQINKQGIGRGTCRGWRPSNQKK